MKEERQAKFLSRSASQRGVRARESESEREREEFESTHKDFEYVGSCLPGRLRGSASCT